MQNNYWIGAAGGLAFVVFLIALTAMGGVGLALLVPVFVAVGIALVSAMWVLGRRRREHPDLGGDRPS